VRRAPELLFFVQTGGKGQWDNSSVPCLLVLLVVAFPRIVLVLMFLMSTYLQRAYHDLLMPILGFLFLPLTTIVYAWMVNSHLPLEGINLLYLILAVVIDMGGWSGGEYHRRRRW
jgi:uncharacterized oligopeptide transporter (OPT) family protein